MSATCRSGSARPRPTAIAYAQQGVEPPRPLTHDLLKDVIETLGHQVTQVRIVELRDKVFYAILVIDGRPRSAPAPPTRSPSPCAPSTEIVVAEAVLDEAGVALTPEEDDEVEKFREFLDQVSAEDFENPHVDPQADPGDDGTPREP